MKSNIIICWGISLAVISCLLAACSKMDGSYKNFLEGGEITYAKKADSVWVLPGNEQAKLVWIITEAPNVNKYVIYWNNGNDSIAAPANTAGSDTNSIIITGLNEGNYTFKIYSYDKKGNPSVGREVVGQVFGNTYTASLSNRKVKATQTVNGQFQAIWYDVDSTNITTEVKYIDTLGTAKVIYLSPDSSALPFPADFDPGQPFYFRSSYKPSVNAIDSFTVTHYDSSKVSKAEVSKKLWAGVLLTNDTEARSNCPLSWLWDGQPADYPEVFYTGSNVMPCTFTIDLGKEYQQLLQVEEWGRTKGFYNPKEFEVWGIADTTNASTTLLAADPGWKDESIAKGWTLLAEISRNDNGIDGWTQDIIPGHPPVRYIRIRVLNTFQDKQVVHISELSFWYKP